VEEKPRETVVIFISPEEITVQGERVATMDAVLEAGTPEIAAVAERLDHLSKSVIGLSTRAVAQSQEVTILADRTVPFTVIKRVMSTCTHEGYSKVSLAVLQKANTQQVAGL
jgi:hypothetical protein